LAYKALWVGYFQPSMQKDAQDLVRRCDKCQKFLNILRYPPKEMTLIAGQWPFTERGTDIVGPLPQGKGQVKFVVVTIDYFTRWLKAKVSANIIEKNI
jgi:hypothetical protein